MFLANCNKLSADLALNGGSVPSLQAVAAVFRLHEWPIVEWFISSRMYFKKVIYCEELFQIF